MVGGWTVITLIGRLFSIGRSSEVRSDDDWCSLYVDGGRSLGRVSSGQAEVLCVLFKALCLATKAAK